MPGVVALPLVPLPANIVLGLLATEPKEPLRPPMTLLEVGVLSRVQNVRLTPGVLGRALAPPI